MNDGILNIPSLDIYENEESYFKIRDGYIKSNDSLNFSLNINANTMSEVFVQNIVNSINPDLQLAFAIRKLNGTIEGNLLQPLNYRANIFYEIGNFKVEQDKIFSIMSGKLIADETRGKRIQVI